MEYGLIGEKLGHSFSSDIHSKLFGYNYELREVSKDELDSFMRNKAFKAINVTIPYKEVVIPYLDEISPTAKSIGAVNTIINKNGKLYGDNTDFLGLSALITHLGLELTGKKVLILGSGGTSKTALAVVKKLGCKEVFRVSRNGADCCIAYDVAKANHSDADVIINTTPCGMYPKIGEAPVELSDYPNLSGVVDAVYNPLRSKLICDAKKRGITAEGGLYMLVAQAVYAAEKFVDKKVDKKKIDEIYYGILKSKENIVLVGMPSCGKTTVGRILASETAKCFIDTDEEIEKFSGKSISEIFAELGEKGFREIESSVIEKVSALQNAVISTGGGVVLRERNTELLKENGRIYFIDRPLDSLISTADRPLSSNRSDLEKLYKDRYDIYLGSCDKQIIPSMELSENVKMIKEEFYNENTCN